MVCRKVCRKFFSDAAMLPSPMLLIEQLRKDEEIAEVDTYC
jgi:hypothetical protein